MDPTTKARPALGRQRLLWSLMGIAGLAMLAGILWICVVVLPARIYPALSDQELAGLTPAERAERREGRDRLQNDARNTLLQGLAALLILVSAGIGATVTLRQIRIGIRQVEVARQQAQDSDRAARKQLALAQQAQLTERFTRAVDQLGSSTVDVRLGGIYALERIAHDWPHDRPTIVKVLSAFIREHAPWPPEKAEQPSADEPFDQIPALERRAPDVQAALSVLTSQPQPPSLQLSNTDLRHGELKDAGLIEADLRGAALQRANLREAHLERAILFDADLEQANLRSAYLENADLRKARLAGAVLRNANLNEAVLSIAHLEGAVLGGAQLKVAILTGAHLEGAVLNGAQLQRADLRGVNLKRARLRNANLEGAILDGANLEDAVLQGAYLKGARANARTRWPSGWDQSHREAAGVMEVPREVADATEHSLPDEPV